RTRRCRCIGRCPLEIVANGGRNPRDHRTGFQSTGGPSARAGLPCTGCADSGDNSSKTGLKYLIVLSACPVPARCPNNRTTILHSTKQSVSLPAAPRQRNPFESAFHRMCNWTQICLRGFGMITRHGGGVAYYIKDISFHR